VGVVDEKFERGPNAPGQMYFKGIWIGPPCAACEAACRGRGCYGGIEKRVAALKETIIDLLTAKLGVHLMKTHRIATIVRKEEL